jgi:hypothetical protein
METYKPFPEKLKAVLEELEKVGRLNGMKVEVEPSGGGRFVADVTSPSFADIPEELHQELVWGKILEKLDDSEQRRVEYVFTPSPEDELSSDEQVRRPRKSAKQR